MTTPAPYTAPRGPMRDQLDAILASRVGSLERTPFPLLLLAMAVGEKSGSVELRRNQLQKKIIFDNGSPVDCRSNIATETLSRFLVSAKKLSESDAHAALAVSASRGVPLGEVLIERELIAPTELYRMLQQSLGRKLLEPFGWKSGTFEIADDASAAGSALRVKVPQLILTGIVKVESQETADESVAFAKGKYLAIGGDPLFALDDLRLSGDQQKVLDAAHRAVKFDEASTSLGIAQDDLNRIVLALLLLGLITATAQPAPMPASVQPPSRTAKKQPAAAETPAVFTPVFEPTLPAIPPASGEEVMAAFLSYRRKDPFDLLGVAETAGLPEFIRAFIEMSEKFLPSKFVARDDVREKAQEVFLAAARAYAELAHPSRRETLIARRAKAREEAEASAKRGAAALIDPEELYKSARRLAEAGKIREALSSFEMAAECDVQNGTYAAEAAWCRFQLKASPPANVLRQLKNAIRIDPECGPAHLYAARVQWALGARVEAQGYLGRAESLMPKDARIAEAQREMR